MSKSTSRRPPARGRSESDPEPEPIELPLEDQIDLHPFRPKEILEVVESYLEAAVEAGFAEVRLIHGKGTGFQRDRVRSLLTDHPSVIEFSDAPSGRGHWGATIVRLRLPQSSD